MIDSSVHPAGHPAFPSPARTAPARPGLAALLQTTAAREYREMEQAFRASGGLAGTDEVIRLLGVRTDQPISVLARWIVDRDIVSFEWNARTVVPLFQFDLPALTLRPEVTAVVRELAAVLDGWDIGLWFVRTNAWLGDASPLEHLDLDARAVHDAARADRYLARS